MEVSVDDIVMVDLGDRLMRLEDEQAKLGTLHRYGDTLEHGDRDEFLDCFTPDPEYTVLPRLCFYSGFAYKGHEQLGSHLAGHTQAPVAFHKHVR
jgi:hypothetical protein